VDLYPWIVLGHIIGAFIFAMSHGVAAWASLQLDKEHDPNRIRALLEQLFRQPLGLLGRHRNLKTIFAGIARARDEAGKPVELARAGIHEPHRGGLCTKWRQH